MKTSIMLFCSLCFFYASFFLTFWLAKFFFLLLHFSSCTSLEVLHSLSSLSLLLNIFSACTMQFKLTWRDFPGGPVAKTQHFTAGIVGSIPGLGIKIPHATQYSQNYMYYYTYMYIYPLLLTSCISVVCFFATDKPILLHVIIN